MKVNVAEHISTLLYQKDRVIIPNLGGFCATYKSANTEKYGNVSPPTKEIYFDESLQFHDNVLIEDIVQKHQISYKEAITEVEAFVNDIKNNIGSKAIVVSNIGRLYLDARNDIVLAPSSVNFLEDAFGLPKMNYYPISRNEEKTAILPTPEPKEQKAKTSIKKIFLNLWNDQSAKAVIILILLLIVIIPQLSKLANQKEEPFSPMIMEDNQNLVNKDKTLKPFEETTVLDDVEEATILPKETVEVNKKVETVVEEQETKNEAATTNDRSVNVKPETTNTMNQSKDVEATSSSTAKKYIVSIGNFSTQNYANEAMKDVRKKGYEVYTKKNGPSHRVGILITCEPSEIDQKIIKIKSQFPDAWLMNRN
ncbi:MAG: SPOR domain-containing protein [Saprospiraceae bacterium]